MATEEDCIFKHYQEVELIFSFKTLGRMENPTNLDHHLWRNGFIESDTWHHYAWIYDEII